MNAITSAPVFTAAQVMSSTVYSAPVDQNISGTVTPAAWVNNLFHSQAFMLFRTTRNYNYHRYLRNRNYTPSAVYIS